MVNYPFEAGVFYSICQPIEVGCTLYSDIGLTTPAGNKYYSDGVWCYEVFGNGVVIAKTSVADCFITTTSTTTSSTTTPNNHYVQQMYVVPYVSENFYYWCDTTSGLDTETVYINTANPTTLGAGQYLSLSDTACVSSYNGQPITNYVFVWVNPDDYADQRIYRINNSCLITNSWLCYGL